jgi:hypothetical protein
VPACWQMPARGHRRAGTLTRKIERRPQVCCLQMLGRLPGPPGLFSMAAAPCVSTELGLNGPCVGAGIRPKTSLPAFAAGEIRAGSVKHSLFCSQDSRLDIIRDNE